MLESPVCEDDSADPDEAPKDKSLFLYGQRVLADSTEIKPNYKLSIKCQKYECVQHRKTSM